MSQLKPSFVVDIYRILEESRFTKSDFDLELPKSGKTLLKLSFLHKPEYLLVLSEEKRRESYTVKHNYDLSSQTETRTYREYVVKLIPGSYKIEDQSTISDLGDLLSLIPDWCSNIRDDLYALAPKTDPLEELRRKLDEDVEALINEPEDFFSQEEASKVDARFEQLFEDLCELKDQFDINNQQIEDIKQEFQEFRDSARAYPKGTWAKVTINKLTKTMGALINTPEGRKLLFDQIKKVLGGE